MNTREKKVYNKLSSKAKEVIDTIGFKNYSCKSAWLSHVTNIDNILNSAIVEACSFDGYAKGVATHNSANFHISFKIAFIEDRGFFDKFVLRINKNFSMPNHSNMVWYGFDEVSINELEVITPQPFEAFKKLGYIGKKYYKILRIKKYGIDLLV